MNKQLGFLILLSIFFPLHIHAMDPEFKGAGLVAGGAILLRYSHDIATWMCVRPPANPPVRSVAMMQASSTVVGFVMAAKGLHLLLKHVRNL